MKLEVGKHYRDKAGRECVVESHTQRFSAPFLVKHEEGLKIYHYEDGRGNIYGPYSLVEEIKPAAKFKVGDRVRIVGNAACSANKIGDVGVVILDRLGECKVKVIGGPDNRIWSYVRDLEPIPSTRFKVGETYQTRAHGDNYKCINVNEDGSAHLAFDARTPAYVWDADGRSLSLSSEWDIVFPPVIETKHHAVTVEGNRLTIVYKVIDGKPDTDNAQLVSF